MKNALTKTYTIVLYARSIFTTEEYYCMTSHSIPRNLSWIYQSLSHNGHMFRQILTPQSLLEHHFRDRVLDFLIGDEEMFLGLIESISSSLREFEVRVCLHSEAIDMEIALMRASMSMNEMNRYISLSDIKSIWMDCFRENLIW